MTALLNTVGIIAHMADGLAGVLIWYAISFMWHAKEIPT